MCPPQEDEIVEIVKGEGQESKNDDSEIAMSILKYQSQAQHIISKRVQDFPGTANTKLNHISVRTIFDRH